MKPSPTVSLLPERDLTQAPAASAPAKNNLLRQLPSAGESRSWESVSAHPVIVFFTSCWGKATLSGESTVNMSPGTIVVLAPHHPIHLKWSGLDLASGPAGYVLELQEERIRQTVNLMQERYPLSELEHEEFLREGYVSIDLAPVRDTLSRLVHTCYATGPSWQLIADLQLQELLVHLLGSPARSLLLHTGTAWARSHRMASALQFINENLHRHFTVEEVAQHTCLSEPSLYRLFRQEMDVSPIDYITQEKIRKARMLLSSLEHSVGDICFSCGFNSVTYFIKVFKKAEGITPKQYQRRVWEERSFAWKAN
jgi:AraC-like DNA-binding protein